MAVNNVKVFMEKKSFEDIEEIVRTGHLEVLGRSQEDEEKYQAYKRHVLLEWKTVGDLILVTHFGLQWDVDNEGKKFVPFPNPVVASQNIKCLKNDFPYNFENDTLHFIVWRLDGEVETNDIMSALEDLKTRFTILKYTCYINPPHLKSVLNVHHAHIVAKVDISDDLDKSL